MASNAWNLKPGTGQGTYQPGDVDVFDDTAGLPNLGHVALNLQNVAPKSVEFSNSTLAYSVSGSFGITGSASLTVDGGGSVTLATTNSYTGATTISAGTLQIGGNGSLGAGGNYAAAIANSGALVFNTGASQTLSGPLSGNGSLTQSGPGTLKLANSNSNFSGNTTLGGGVLQVGANSALGSGNLALAGGALTSSDTTAYSLANPLVLGGSGTLGNAVNSGGLTFTASTATLTANSQLTVNSPVTINSVIGGNYGLTKAGPGTLTLTAGNAYAGSTLISNGVLKLLSNWSPYQPTDLSAGQQYRLAFVTSGSIAGRAADGGPTTIAGYNAFVTSAATAVTGLNAFGTTWSAIVSFCDKPGAYTYARDNTGTNPNYTGVPIYNLGNQLVAQTNAELWGGTIENPIDVNELGNVVPSGTIVNTGAFPDGTSDTNGDGPLGYPSGGYVWFGYASTTDSSWIKANRFSTGAPPIYAMSGVLTAASPNVLPTTTDVTISSGGTLDLNHVSQQIASLSGNGSITNSSSLGDTSVLTLMTSGSTTFSGTIDGTVAPISLVMSGSGTQVLAGSLLGPGSLSVNSGTLILSGTNTYTGGTDVAGGTLTVNTSAALPAGTSLTVGAGGTFIFDPSVSGSPVVGSQAVAAVPEPGTLALLAAGLALGAGIMWRKRRGG